MADLHSFLDTLIKHRQILSSQNPCPLVRAEFLHLVTMVTEELGDGLPGEIAVIMEAAVKDILSGPQSGVQFRQPIYHGMQYCNTNNIQLICTVLIYCFNAALSYE